MHWRRSLGSQRRVSVFCSAIGIPPDLKISKDAYRTVYAVVPRKCKGKWNIPPPTYCLDPKDLPTDCVSVCKQNAEYFSVKMPQNYFSSGNRQNYVKSPSGDSLTNPAPFQIFPGRIHDIPNFLLLPQHISSDQKEESFSLEIQHTVFCVYLLTKPQYIV